jgi:hypothetical protein
MIDPASVSQDPASHLPPPGLKWTKSAIKRATIDFLAGMHRKFQLPDIEALVILSDVLGCFTCIIVSPTVIVIFIFTVFLVQESSLYGGSSAYHRKYAVQRSIASSRWSHFTIWSV